MMSTQQVRSQNVLRAVFAGLLTVTLSACAERDPGIPVGDVTEGVDRAEGIDATMAMDGPSFMDVAPESDIPVAVDRGIDIPAMIDRGVDVPAARDDGPLDVGADAGPPLPELPVEPMGVPAPGSECTGDAGVRGGDPAIAPPRPIVPQSVSRVTSQRPSFRWVLPAGTTGARVEVCADRCCTRVITTMDADGTTVRPTTALPPGVVYWRMFGRAGGVTGLRASYTWEFEVRRRDTPVDSSWGTIRDFTGDGYDDLMFHGPGSDAGTNPVYVVAGGPGGPEARRVYAPAAIRRDGRAQPVGDFNGDGRADVAYNSGSDQFALSIGILESRIEGEPRALRLNVSSVRNAYLSTPTVTDWNGDGYSDLVTTVGFYSERPLTVLGSVLVVYHGSPTGLGAWPQEVFPMAAPISRPLVELMGSLEDFDLDGYGDVHVIDRRYASPGRGRFLVYGQAEGALRIQLIPDPPADSMGHPYNDTVSAEAVGDLDGDGRGEVTFVPGGGGLVWLYLGSVGFTASPISFVESAHPGESIGFGDSVRSSDLNGDGFADLLISAPGSFTETIPGTPFPFNQGRMYVYFGARGGLRENPVGFDRVRPTDPEDTASLFATSLVAPGDLDADGFDDAIVHDPSRATICYLRGRMELAGASLGGCIATPGNIGGGF